MAKTIYADDMANALDYCDAPIEVLSLDCFDTLIWRTTPKPNDVFCELAPPLRRLSRMVAEHTARLQKRVTDDLGEITLDDIYRRALPHADAAERQSRIAAELELEHRHCVAFPPGIELIRRAKKRGLKIIVVSDTYLHEQELRDLLAAKLGRPVLDLIDVVFSSCDHGCSKSNGLFQTMLERMRVAPDRILHLGDNPAADVLHAEIAGLRALHLEQGDHWLNEQWRLEAAALLMWDDRLRNERPPLLPHRPQLAQHARALSDPPQRLGYSTLGPLMYGFGRWVLNEARALSENGKHRVKVCFLMRDGHLPKQAYEALRGAGDPKAYAIEISRFTAYAATFAEPDDITSYLSLMLHGGRLEALAHQLQFTPEEIEAIDRAAPLEGNPAHRLWKEVQKPVHMKRIVERSAKARALLFNYLRKQIDLQRDDVLLMVDVGAAGTVQNRIQPHIEAHFNVRVEGRYMLLRDVPRAGESKKGFFGPDRYDGRLIDSIYTYMAVIEQMCTVAQGSVIGYTPEGGPIRKDADFMPEQIEQRLKVQQACVRFVREARDAARTPAGQTDDAADIGARAAFVRMIYLPTREEAGFFESFAHDVNLGVKDTVRLADMTTAGEDLRRLGPIYVNSNPRINSPAELRWHSLDLALGLFARRRFDIELRPTDFRIGEAKLPVMVMRDQQSHVAQIDLQPTHDGYLSALIPIGRCEYSVGVLFGQLYQWVQIESVRAVKVDQQMRTQFRDDEIDLTHMAVHEGTLDVGGGLLHLESQHAFSYYGTPQEPTQENWCLRVVFRPLVIRDPNAPPAASDDAPTQAAQPQATQGAEAAGSTAPVAAAPASEATPSEATAPSPAALNAAAPNPPGSAAATPHDSTASAANAAPAGTSARALPQVAATSAASAAALAMQARPTLPTGAHMPANQICIASCYCTQWPEVRDFLRDLDRELQQRGVQLLVLATDDPKELGIPALQIPYFLAGFDSTFPHTNGLAPAHPARMYAEADQVWGNGCHPMATTEHGVAACEAFYHAVAEILRPCAAFLWNTTLPHGRIARNVFMMHGVPSYSFERGLLPGTFQIESIENNAFGDLFTNFQLRTGLHEDLEDLGDPQTAYATIRDHYADHLPSKYPSAQWRDRAALDAQYGTAGKKLVVVFGSAEGSSIAPSATPSMGYSSPLFHDTSSAMQALCAKFADAPDVAILFQDHPINASNRTAHALPANCIETKREHIHSLIAAADRVAVLGTTTVQYECLLHDVPVLSLSRNLIDHVGAAYSCVNTGFDHAWTDWWNDTQATSRRLATRRLIVYLCRKHLIGHGPTREFVRRGVEHMADFAAGLGRDCEVSVDERFAALIESIRVLMLGNVQMEAA